MLSAEELLAGGGLTYEVAVPAAVLRPAGGGNGSGASGLGGGSTIRLRPLTVHDLQLVTRAAKENDQLLATVMVQRALVEPELTVPQVAGMHAGLLHFILGEVNRISGITAVDEELVQAAEAPLARAAFLLAREFGWTPAQVGELTLGQVLLHLQLLGGVDDS